MRDQPANQDCDSISTRIASCVDVVIPAFNEELSLPLVLGDLPNVRNIIVVNNDSTDQTAEIAAQLGAIVPLETQRGYGSACLKGLATIQERIEAGEPEPEIVVFLDADYSDHPQYLTELVKPIFAGDADFVLGSRLLGEREAGAMPVQSIYGNKLACFLMRYLFGIKYTDLGPFRAIRYESLTALQMSDENFGWTIEMQIKAARADLRTVEIPVPYRCRVGVSKISGTIMGSARAGYKILYTIAKYGLKKNVKSQQAPLKTQTKTQQVVT